MPRQRQQEGSRGRVAKRHKEGSRGCGPLTTPACTRDKHPRTATHPYRAATAGTRMLKTALNSAPRGGCRGTIIFVSRSGGPYGCERVRTVRDRTPGYPPCAASRHVRKPQPYRSEASVTAPQIVLCSPAVACDAEGNGRVTSNLRAAASSRRGRRALWRGALTSG